MFARIVWQKDFMLVIEVKHSGRDCSAMNNVDNIRCVVTRFFLATTLWFGTMILLPFEAAQIQRLETEYKLSCPG